MTLFGNRPNVYTIPPGAGFLAGLSMGLKALEKELSLSAPDITLFLPTFRSIRAFQAFEMDSRGGTPALLPNLKALGGLDEDDILLSGLLAGEADLSLPPAITSLKRMFLLQEEIARFSKDKGFEDLSARQRLELAAELGRLLDQMQNARLSGAVFHNLVPGNLATHWQKIVGFLGVITEAWPKTLKKMGLMDPVERRNQLIDYQIRAWQSDPPETPVIAAGSTGSVPATRRLLKAVAGLPKGVVILPGFNAGLDSEDWDAVDETHPQFMMKETLGAFGIPRDKVLPWPYSGDPGPAAAVRIDFFIKALKPASRTGTWHQEKFDAKEAARSFDVIEAEGIREEALAIALMMREALETPGKKAALVTPDRDLARRVRAELKRWNLDVDDSAGQPLAATPQGAFFMLLADLAVANFPPTVLLAFLKNPLCRCGMARDTLLALARDLDKMALRGPAGRGGIRTLARLVRGSSIKNKKPHLEFLKSLEKETSGLAGLLKKTSTPLGDIFSAHVAAARALSREGDSEPLWQGPGGEALAALADRMKDETEDLGHAMGQDYAGILRALLDREVVRRPFGSHPRLAILGALEARMQTTDLMILGSLNEGTWPPSAYADPWMNQDLRKTLGLPTAEQRVGQSAHDFLMALGAPEVVLTRSLKLEGTPATPSRWLQRARALMGGKLPGARNPWRAWARALDWPETFAELAPPKPRPPAANRPGKLSVTSIEKLVHDPYSIYARDILKLKPLDPLEADPGAADKGLILHEIFEVFFRKNDCRLPENALGALIEAGERVFDKSGFSRPAIRAFWWPRFLEVAGAFLTEQQTRAGDFETLGVELKGELSLKTTSPFTLTAKADRIDRRKSDGGYWIIDYKSGALPYPANLKDGTKPQLPLEALIAEAGGFSDLDPGGVSGLEFWNIGKPGPQLELRTVTGDLEEATKNAAEGLRALVEHFADERNPYLAVPDPSGHRFGDYDPLSRYREWRNRKPDGGGS